MASKQFKTHCQIINYLTVADPDLAQLCNGLCVGGSLSSKGKPGVTFLMPVDKAFRAKLEKLAYSDNIDDAASASAMLNALIIRDVFKSPSDWMTKKDDIPNSLYPSQHVEVDSATASEIVFKSGARASPDPGFKDSSSKHNLAVWRLTGEIPVTTDKPSKGKYSARPARGRVGGYVPTDEQTKSLRFQIGLAVENTYTLCQLKRQSGDPQEDVYLETVLSLVHYIMHIRSDISLLYNKILPLLSFDKIDFYILVEPHRAAGAYLLDDLLIAEWWAQRHSHRRAFTLQSVVKEVEGLLCATGHPELVYADRTRILAAIAKVRQRLLPQIEAKPRESVAEIEKFYLELEKSNTINGEGPVYPAQLAAFYAANTGLKLLQDELRYTTFGAFCTLEREFSVGAFYELTNLIGECFYTTSADERAQAQKLLNKNTLKYLIAPSEFVQQIKLFTYTTMFMYIPLTSAECKTAYAKYTIRRPDPNNIKIWNIQEFIYMRHKRLLGHNDGAPLDIAAILRNLDVTTLDPALREALKTKLT